MDQKEVVCKQKPMITQDTLEVIQGKWRIPVIISLKFDDKGFGEVQRDIAGISPRMLSQEFKALEIV